MRPGLPRSGSGAYLHPRAGAGAPAAARPWTNLGLSHRQCPARAAKSYTAARIAKLVRAPKPANRPDFPEMPAMPQVPDDELRKIAEWIVSLKK